MNRTIEQRKSEQNFLYRLKFFDPDDPDLGNKLDKRLNSLTRSDTASRYNLTKEEAEYITKFLKDKNELANEINYLRLYIKEILPDLNKLIHSTIIRYDEVDSVRLEELIKNKKYVPHKNYIINEVKRLNKYVDYKEIFKLNDYNNIDSIIKLNDLVYEDKDNKSLVNAINANTLKESDYDLFYFYSHNFNNVNSKVYTINDSLQTLKARHQDVVKHFSAFDHGGKNKDLDITRLASQEANNILEKKGLFEDYKKVSKLTHYSNKIKASHIFNKEQFFGFIKEAKQNSQDKVFAEYFIKYLYDKHNIEVTLKENTQDYDLCSTCKKIYNTKVHKDNCPSCGVDFNVVCLVCGNKHKNAICNVCDLSSADYQNYEILIRDINLAKARSDYKTAKFLLDGFDNQIIRKLDKYKKNTEYKQILKDINLFSSLDNLEGMFNKDFNQIAANNAINLFKRDYIKDIKSDPDLARRLNNIDQQYEKYKEAVICPTCGTVNFDKNSNVCINAKCNMVFSHTCWNCNTQSNYLKNISCSCGATKAVTDKMQQDILRLENGLLSVSKNTYSPSSLKTELDTFISNYTPYNKPNTKLNAKIGHLQKEANEVIINSQFNNINKLFLESNININNINVAINKFKMDNVEIIRNDYKIKELVNSLEVKYNKYKNSNTCPSCSTRIFDPHAKVCSNQSCRMVFVNLCWNCHKENNLLLNTKCLCGANSTITNKMKKDLELFDKNLVSAKSGFYSATILQSDLNLFTKEYESYNKPNTIINEKFVSYNGQIRNLLQQEENTLKQANILITKINDLYKEKKIIEANTVLQQLKLNYPTHSIDKSVEVVETTYNSLQNELRRLKQYHNQNNETEVIVSAKKIKDICIDCSEVEDILNSLVILPPKNVKFEVIDDEVVITYLKSESFDTKYIILKNPNNEPKDYDDAEVSFTNDVNLSFKHRPLAAVTYFYKVYAVRDGVFSNGVSSKGITVYPNIDSNTLNQEVLEDAISVSFEAPLNASNVLITKSLVGKEDTEVVEVTNMSSFIDKDVILGNQYNYTFITEYSHNGDMIKSNPFSRIYTPTVTPKTPVIKSFDRLKEEIFKLSFNNEVIDKPVFYTSNNNINIIPNKVYNNVEFANFIKTHDLSVLSYDKTDNNDISFKVEKEQAIYILLSTTLYGFTKISNVILINNSVGIENLESLVIGSKAYIQFNFVNNVDKAYISYNSDEYYDDFKMSNNFIEVLNYNKRVNEPIELGSNEKMYITIYTEQTKKNEVIISEGSKILINNLSTKPIVYFKNIKQSKNKLSLVFNTSEKIELNNVKIKLYNKKTLLTEITEATLNFKGGKKNGYYQLKYQLKNDQLVNCNDIVITFEYLGHEIKFIEMRK